MKRQLTMTFAVALLSTAAFAQDAEPISIDVTLDAASKYVWHGLNIDDEWVFQPGVTFSNSGLSFGIWGNLELTNWNAPNYVVEPQGKFSEIDFWLEYGSSTADHDWNVGVIDYQFPGTGWQRYREWFAGIGKGEMYVTLYSGDNNFSGSYLTLYYSHSFATATERTIDFEAELSAGDARSNSYLYGYSKASISDLLLSGSTTISLGDKWSVTPGLHYSTLLNENLLSGQPRRTNTWFSVSFGASF